MQSTGNPSSSVAAALSLPFIPVERADLRQLEMRLAAIPGMKISYELNGYKKVSGDYFYIIPKGKKCVVWFTHYKTKPAALFFELDPRDHSKIKFITIREPHPQCCDAALHSGDYGTVCYGTLFAHEAHQFFTIENIHVYKSRPVDALSVDEKYALTVGMFERDGLGCGAIDASATATTATVQTGQSRPTRNARVWFGLPVKCASYADALRISTSYAVYAIQARFGNQTDNRYHQNCQNAAGRSSTVIAPDGPGAYVQPESKPQTNAAMPRQPQASQGQRTFMVRADRQADLYSLVCPASGCAEPEYAHIGDYKTSVFMNSVFRRVRENVRLDAIEESDDETEFQNSEPDKNVNLEKSVLMLCSFNYRFKRWVPLKCVGR